MFALWWPFKMGFVLNVLCTISTGTITIKYLLCTLYSKSWTWAPQTFFVLQSVKNKVFDIHIWEFLSDFRRMDSEESSLKSFSMVETTEARTALLSPRAANTYRNGFRAHLMYTRYKDTYNPREAPKYRASLRGGPTASAFRNRQTKYGTQQVRKMTMVKNRT